MADRISTDNIFKNIARQYTEVYGNVLLNEKAEIERQKTVYITPRADRAIKPLIKKRKRGAAIKIAAGIAAAVILAVSIPAIQNRTKITDNAPESSNESDNGDMAEAGAMMPLTFALPYGYTVADSKLDNGQSVYYLDHVYGDNVVLTMEGTEAEAKYDYGELGEVYIDGQHVKGLSTEDYQILVFICDGVFYTLSCKYDLGTIVTLYREIVY